MRVTRANKPKLILRRLRSIGVYSEMLPCTQKLKDLTWKPVGIILSGGPSSVYAPDAPNVDPLVFELGVPVLYVVNLRQKHDEKVANILRRGVCFGNQLIGIIPLGVSRRSLTDGCPSVASKPKECGTRREP